MTNRKRRIPLAVLEILEPFLTKTSELVEFGDTENEQLLKFVDKDPNSDFYFIIEKSKFESGKLVVLLTQAPKNRDVIDKYTFWTHGTHLETQFNEWLTIVERYTTIKSTFDDPILKQYEEEFFTDFEIIDNDANFKSFDFNQQLFLEDYLDKVIISLETQTDKENEDQLNEITNDINDLKKKLTVTTKKATIEKLVKIWAKIRKVGLPLIKEAYVQVRNELIKQLIQGQLGQ